jgi:sugar lactone lactonase YvrE
MLTLAGCGDGDRDSGNSGSGSNNGARLTGRIDDGLPQSPIANAVCRLVDPSGTELATTTADATGVYSVSVSPDTTGFLDCHPPGLAGLRLSTFVSTIGQPPEATQQEEVSPTTSVIAALIRRINPADPQTTKAQILADLALQTPNTQLLVDAMTSLFNALLEARLDVDIDAALDDLLEHGTLSLPALQSIVPRVTQEITAAEQRRKGRVAAAFAALAAVNSAPSGGDHGSEEGADGGDSDSGSGGGGDTGGGADGSADDGAEGSPIAEALCLFVSLDGRILAQTTADANGRFLFRLNPVPQGFISCAPPRLPGLVVTTFVRAGKSGERIDVEKVSPLTTVVSNVIQEFRAAVPRADLQALKTALLKDIADGRPNITLLVAASVKLYNALFKAGINVRFALALADLFADGKLALAGTELIAAEVERFVTTEAQRQGVTIDLASTTGTIIGSVTDERGVPIAGVQVVATQEGARVGRATTDANGIFLLQNIRRGTTTVSIQSMTDSRVTVTVVAVATVEADMVSAFLNVVSIVVEPRGTLAVVDAVRNAVLRVNPSSGDRTLVSGCVDLTCRNMIGSGPPLKSPQGIAVEKSGTLVVVDSFLQAVIRIDPDNGNRTVVSRGSETVSSSIGSGPPLKSPQGIAVEKSGTLVVIDSILSTGSAVVRVDPASGNRTVVSGGSGAPSGSDQRLFFPQGIAVEASGTLVVVDSYLQAVIRIDPVNGNRTVVSRGSGALSIGDGPDLDGPLSIAVGTTGALYIVLADTFFGIRAVVQVDPVSGNRTFVLGTEDNVGNQPALFSEIPIASAVEANGSLVVIDAFRSMVVRIDPLTGDRTPISGIADTTGSGPPFRQPQALALEADGSLMVLDGDILTQQVVRVDPVSGDRLIVVGGTGPDAPGSGLSFNFLQNVAVEAAGTFVVTESPPGTLLRVDARSGKRTLVSGIGFLGSSTTGSGPLFVSPQGLAVETGGTLVVVDKHLGGFGAVLRVNQDTGKRTVISGCSAYPCTRSIGSGPRLGFPKDIAVEAGGTLVVVESSLAILVRVDPGTGKRTIVSDAITGRGPQLLAPEGIAVEKTTGDLVIVDKDLAAVLRVDPRSGDRTIVSDATTGRGPRLFAPEGIVVETTGTFVVLDASLRAAVRVRPDSGDRTLLSR